ncbi:MAG: DUF2752 domain-containing protein [Sandaracinaceae bacterium]|nr:DUF2752 domain-containing protein [Sandaracinaceae bacterium]
MIKALIPPGILLALIVAGVPLCPTKNFFGIPCPGCGMTRATEAMLTGDFWGMLRLHPLAPFIVPVAIYMFGRATLVSAGLIDGRGKDWLGKLPNPVWFTVGVLLIGLWIARLAGFLGGHPDEVDFSQGWLAQGVMFLFG